MEGTGAKNLTNNQKTNANGKAVWRGIAPSIVDEGWTVQARYDGDSRYSGVNSLAKTYSTTLHSPSLSLNVNPIKVEPRDKYAITGILNDEITDSELPGRKVSFMADLPVIIGDILTDSSGNYAVQELTAPDISKRYDIVAKFNGDSLYNESISAGVLAMRYDPIKIRGIDIQQPSYNISTDGTMVSALNTVTGNIEFEGDEPGLVINSAIDAIQSGTIRVSEGDYNFINPIRPKSNIRIIGDGTDNTILNVRRPMSLIVNAHPNDPTLGIGDRNIVLGNFTINYEGFGGGDAINLVSVEKSRIFQVRIENISRPSDAIDFDACKDMIVESTSFLNIGGSAVHVSDSFTGWESDNKKGSNNITVIDAYASNVGKERKVEPSTHLHEILPFLVQTILRLQKY